LYFVLYCTLCCVFVYFYFNPALGLQLSLIKLSWVEHRCLHGNVPPYLAETLRLTSDVESRRRLRSGSIDTRTVNATSHSRWLLFQWLLHGPGMHCLRRSEHRRRTWRFVASWKHCYSRHPLKTGHDCAIYLLHSVNCKFWLNVLYSAPAAFFAIYSITIILTFIITQTRCEKN